MGNARHVAQDAFNQRVAQGDDVGLVVSAGRLFFAEVDVGGGERVVVAQGGIKRELRVFGAAFNALGGGGAGLGFVVDQQMLAVALQVHAVDFAHQRERVAQRPVEPLFGHLERRARGFVRRQPV